MDAQAYFPSSKTFVGAQRGMDRSSAAARRNILATLALEAAIDDLAGLLYGDRRVFHSSGAG
jgi:hypothetical protein